MTTEQHICAVCQRDCTDLGWVQRIADDKVTRTTCTECDADERFRRYADTGYIDTWLMTQAMLVAEGYGRNKSAERRKLSLDIHGACDGLRELVNRFELVVWFGGMQKFARDSKYKGTSAAKPVASPWGEVKVMCYTMCGRAMITLDAPSCDVTVITEEDASESRMGLNGLHATAAEARGLLQAVIDAWTRGEIAMADDTGVQLAC